MVNRLSEGRYSIPDFQREFEWEPWDILELMKSIFRDYYIGSLLLWKGKESNYEALSCEPIYGHSGEGRSEFIVLDGQQRLTAMHYAFLAPDRPLPGRKSRAHFYINVENFMAEDYDDAFHYAYASRPLTKVLEDRNLQFETHMFPLSVLGAGLWELANWVQGYQSYWVSKANSAEDAEDEVESVPREIAEGHADAAAGFSQYLKELLEEYQVSYIELDQDLEIDKVCDIFTQVNSRGVRLDVFDLMNAMLKPRGLQLKQMFRDASTRLEWVDTDRMNVYILQVMSMLKQDYCSPKYLYFLLPGQVKPIRLPDGKRETRILIPDGEAFESTWNQAISAIEESIKLLRHPQEYGAISSKYLPYVSILPAFSALQSHIKELPPLDQLSAKRKVQHWYWASVFTNRYSGAVESTATRDFIDVRAWIKDEDIKPPVLGDFEVRLQNMDLRGERASNSSTYTAIFNLLVIQGARDWITGNAPQHDDLDDHHIVPEAWSKRNLEGNTWHTILNRTPLTAETNRNVVRDRLPNEYLPEMIEASGEAAVRGIMDSHFISEAAQSILMRNPFTPDDFEEFISERQHTLKGAIENLLIKERIALPPDLRSLDQQIEDVELRLRSTIVLTLDNDPAELPQHVLRQAQDRIEKARRRNPAIDMERFAELGSVLEYCDLRELEQAIASPATWGKFEDRFANKVGLATKFGQLSELRNGIRHARAVDDVARMEGEAAILWFGQVLSA